MHKLEKVVCGKSNQTKRKTEKKIFIFLTSITMQNIRNWFMRSVLFLFILWLWKSYKSAAYTCLKFMFSFRSLWNFRFCINCYFLYQVRQISIPTRFDHYMMNVSQPTFQRRINVVSTLWINVEITLIRRWKRNKIRRRILNVAQRWYNLGVRRWNNVDTTLSWRYFSVCWTLVKAISKPVGLVISTDW